MTQAKAVLLASIALCAACSESTDDTSHLPAPTNITAEVSDTISTVVHVTWETRAESIGYVQYGPTRDMEFSSPLESEETEEHAMTLLGLTAETEYFFRVVTWDGNDAAASRIQTIETGFLPQGLPRMELEGDGHDLFTVVPLLGATTAVTIINPEGKIVWYHQDDRELDFYRARLSVDGKSLIYNAGSISGDPSDESEMVRVALDGTGSSSIPVPLLAHDFVEHEDGTIGAMVVEFRDFDGEELRGDSIVEIDENGDVTPVWNSWDCFDPAEVVSDELTGWTFGNALDYDPVQDVYYLGMRNLSSIAKIDRQTGECEWVLGFYGSTIDFAQGSARFLHQHQFEVRGDRILIMDNDGAIGNESRVLEYELDLDQNLATEIWSYTSDPSVYTFVLGEPNRLGNETFINWSAAGQLERLNEDDEPIWKLNTPAGIVFGFHTLEESLYPESAPTP
jgi:hypothetical protein